MGIGGGSVLVPWRPAFWIAAEVVLSSTWHCSADICSQRLQQLQQRRRQQQLRQLPAAPPLVARGGSQCEPPDPGRLGPRSAGGCRRFNLQQPTLGRSAKGAHGPLLRACLAKSNHVRCRGTAIFEQISASPSRRWVDGRPVRSAGLVLGPPSTAPNAAC